MERDGKRSVAQKAGPLLKAGTVGTSVLVRWEPCDPSFLFCSSQDSLHKH